MTKKSYFFLGLLFSQITIFQQNVIAQALAPEKEISAILKNPTGAISQAVDTDGGAAHLGQVVYKGNETYQYARAASIPGQKNPLGLGPKVVSQQSGISLTYRGHVILNHPSGQELFPSNARLASEFNRAFAAIQTSSVKNTTNDLKTGKKITATINHFIPMFRKVQFMVLNDLYLYLTGVYELFNLTHFASQKATSCSNKPGEEEVAVFLRAEQQQAANKKALVLSHLINVIQGQMFFICSHSIPLLPKSVAIKTSSMLLEHDYSVDINFLLRDFNNEYMRMLAPESRTKELAQAYNDSIKLQKKYVTTLGQVLAFFAQYADVLKADGNVFFALATTIEKRMAGNQFQKEAQRIAQSNKSREEKIKSLRALKKTTNPINPPLFYFNKETLRALKIIPRLAEDIEKKFGGKASKDTLVDWPDQLKLKAKDACSAYTCDPDPKNSNCAKRSNKNYPIAFFTDADNSVVRYEASAKKLFLNIPMPNGLPYVQEIKKQPEWLNGKDGILSVLGACLGDYSALIGKGILNPCTEQVLLKTQNQRTHRMSGSCDQEIQNVAKIQSAYMNSLVDSARKPAIAKTTEGM